MQTTGEVVAKGVVERSFEFEADGEMVPGILWRPEGASATTPLVLLGHGGTQHKRTPNILGLARRMVRHLGYSAVALDAPGHGERVVDHEAADAFRRDLERRVTTQSGSASLERAPDDQASRRPFVAVGRAVKEWSTVLDLLEKEGGIDERVGYWGVSMGTMIGLPFVAGEPRVTAAVLGLAGLTGMPGGEEREAAARRCSIPVLFIFQWDDQLMSRETGLDLFDAIGSADKAMHVFPGGHVDTPLYERDAYDAFFLRHLGR
jgi:pimeloyl-ACP methyl ester carboxylesterase